jgi:hypothetical protein
MNGMNNKKIYSEIKTVSSRYLNLDEALGGGFKP